MALIENFDVDFEDYIIFHRGIAEAEVKADGHLHIVYQDGYDQDLGDPYGEKLADAEQAKNDAQTAKREAETAQAAAEAAKASAEDLMNAALRSEANSAASASLADIAKQAAQKAKDDAVDAKNAAKQIYDDIDADAASIKDASDRAVQAAALVVESSQAWAIGKRGEFDVESPDPTFENNSKYYATLAKTSETNAAESESTAVQAAETATQAAQQTSQDLADVQDVAADIVKPLEKLEGLTYDSENDSYSIDAISNETIDSYFAEYLPLGAEIITQPTNILLEDGVPITFSVEAVHAKAYQWQWRQSTDQEIVWNDITSEPLHVITYEGEITHTCGSAEGYNTNALTLSSDDDIYPYEFRCVITGENDSEIYSDTVFMIKPITINKQLSSVAAEVGEEATLSFAALNEVAYQWQTRQFGESEWTDSGERQTVPLNYGRGRATSKYIESVSESDYSVVYRCLAIRRDGEIISSDEAFVYSQSTVSQYTLAMYELELTSQRYKLSLNNQEISELEEMLGTFEAHSENWIRTRDQIWALQEENATIEAEISRLEEIIASYNQEGGE